MKMRHSDITRCALFGLAVALVSVGTVGAQTTADTFLIKGVLADASGPLAHKLVIVMPIDPGEGKPVTVQSGAYATLSLDAFKPPKSDKWIYTYRITGDPRLGPQLNPETTTDANGAFSVSVRKELLKPYKSGEVGLGVFNGPVTSTFEPEIIKYDKNAATIDVGRLVFKPVRDPTK